MLKVANSVINASRITGVLPVVNGGTGVTTSTGTGNTVLSASPTLSGDVNLSTGNLVIGTSGKGIDFSITSSGSGTMTSELLADYEEGTWTPVLQRNSGTFACTYTTQTGLYTKIGRQVTLYAEIVINAISVTGTSNNIVQGAPFLPAATTGVGVVSLDSGLTTAVKSINSATNNFQFIDTTGAVLNEDYVAGGTLQFTITYFV